MTSDKEEKPMKLPRFSYQVPEDVTAAFLKEMEESFLVTPGETINVVLRKYFHQKRQAEVLKQFTELPEGSSALPEYGPKHGKPDVSQTGEQTSGES